MYENIDENSLRKKWDLLLSRPLQEWKENIDMTKVAAQDDDIWKFFALFDKFKGNRINFYNAIKSVVIFSEVIVNSYFYPSILLNLTNSMMIFTLNTIFCLESTGRSNESDGDENEVTIHNSHFVFR